MLKIAPLQVQSSLPVWVWFTAAVEIIRNLKIKVQESLPGKRELQLLRTEGVTAVPEKQPLLRTENCGLKRGKEEIFSLKKVNGRPVLWEHCWNPRVKDLPFQVKCSSGEGLRIRNILFYYNKPADFNSTLVLEFNGVFYTQQGPFSREGKLISLK